MSQAISSLMKGEIKVYKIIIHCFEKISMYAYLSVFITPLFIFPLMYLLCKRKANRMNNTNILPIGKDIYTHDY